MFEAGADADTARLEDYIRAARDRWYVIVLAVLVCVATASFLEAQRTPTYTAEARVVVGPTPIGAAAANTLQRPNLEREKEVVASNAIADQAIVESALSVDRLQLLEKLEVRFLPDSDVLRIAYSSTDPEVAALTANAVATEYVATRQTESTQYYQQEVDDLTSALDATNETLTELQEQIGTIDARVSLLQQDTAPLPAVTDEIQRLTTERSILTSTINNTLADQRTIGQNLGAAERNLRSRPTAAEVLGDATIPGTPDGIGRSTLLAAGAVVGLLLGMAGAFLAQRLDRTARTDSQVELALRTRVLGTVPRFGFRRYSGSQSIVMLSPSHSGRIEASRESYRRLATSLSFLAGSENVRSVVLTSSGPGEGKSTTTANLSVALAQAGNQVLLISADMRRPSLEERFALPLAPGLADYLGGDYDAGPIQISDVPNLWVFTAGSKPANPGELLGSEAFGLLIKSAKETMDFVLIDSPPVQSAADTNAMAQHVDGTVVVVDSRRTETSDLLQVRADLDRSGVAVLGSVLNRKSVKRSILGRNPYSYYGVRS